MFAPMGIDSEAKFDAFPNEFLPGSALAPPPESRDQELVRLLDEVGGRLPRVPSRHYNSRRLHLQHTRSGHSLP